MTYLEIIADEVTKKAEIKKKNFLKEFPPTELLAASKRRMLKDCEHYVTDTQILTKIVEFAKTIMTKEESYEFSNDTREEIIELKNRLYDSYFYVKKLHSTIDSFIDTQRRNKIIKQIQKMETSRADIMENLVALEKHYGTVKLLNDHILEVTTKPIVLEDEFGHAVNFGEMKISYDVASVLRKIHVCPYGDGVYESDGDYFHPHVGSGNDVCLGAAEEPIANAHKRNALFDIFIIIEEVLKTYNSKSPYATLGNWNGIACDHCGSYTEIVNKCTICGDEVCNECATLYMNSSGDYYTACFTCAHEKQNRCSNKKTDGTLCNNMFNHKQQTECYACQRRHGRTDQVPTESAEVVIINSCKACGKELASHEIIHCEDCGQTVFCSSCAKSNTCEFCGKVTCPSCMSVCSECGTPTHTKCLTEHDNNAICEHCSIDER
jgi:hypothetical protein